MQLKNKAMPHPRHLQPRYRYQHRESTSNYAVFFLIYLVHCEEEYFFACKTMNMK